MCLNLIKYIVLVMFLIVDIAYSDQDRIYVLNTYEKGQNSHTSPLHTAVNQALLTRNVRVNKSYGALSKRNTMIEYLDLGDTPVNSLYRYYNNTTNKQYTVASTSTYLYTDNEGDLPAIKLKDNLSNGKRWSFVTFKNNLIGMNGTDKPIKWDGKILNTADTDEARTADNLVAELGAPYAELNSTSSNMDSNSWYQYKMAYKYDGTNYSYSTSRSNAIKTGTTIKSIKLTDIPLGPIGTTERYIYRTLGNASKTAVESDNTFYLIATISDNSTLTYIDSMKDSDADNDDVPVLSTVTAGSNVTPELCKYCLIHKDRLFMAGDDNEKSRFYYSDNLRENYFPLINYRDVRVDDGDDITFIKQLNSIFTIGKTNSISRFYTDGTDHTTWTLSEPFTTIGCIAPYSACNGLTNGGANVIYYFSYRGLYVFNGQTSQLISDSVTDVINDVNISNINNMCAVYFKNEFQLSYSSILNGSALNDSVLLYDVIRDAYVLDTKNINSYAIYNSGTDSGLIYSGSSVNDGKIYAHETSLYSLTTYKKSDLDTGTFDDTRTIGTENNPQIELGWDCTIDSWLTELQTKNISINTLDDINTYLPNATIDRPDNDGTWESPVYEINASKLDTLRWNESLNGGNIYWQIKSGNTNPISESYSVNLTNANGTDISSISTGKYIQLKAFFNTAPEFNSPTLNVSNNYLFKLSYNKSGTTKETNINSIWRTGWDDFGLNAVEKQLKRIQVYYRGSASTISFIYRNIEGNTEQNFDIDLSVNPQSDLNDNIEGTEAQKVYTIRLPINKSAVQKTPIGEAWQFELSEYGNDDWHIDKIVILYSVKEIDK